MASGNKKQSKSPAGEGERRCQPGDGGRPSYDGLLKTMPAAFARAALDQSVPGDRFVAVDAAITSFVLAYWREVARLEADDEFGYDELLDEDCPW
jgi:hypothetical protein